MRRCRQCREPLKGGQRENLCVGCLAKRKSAREAQEKAERQRAAGVEFCAGCDQPLVADPCGFAHYKAAVSAALRWAASRQAAPLSREMKAVPSPRTHYGRDALTCEERDAVHLESRQDAIYRAWRQSGVTGSSPGRMRPPHGHRSSAAVNGLA